VIGYFIQTEHVPNEVVYAEYVWIKPSIKIEEEKGMKKEKK
jgi:hypothetical protein